MGMKYNWILKERCMVMEMNKKEFVNELSSKLSYPQNKCIIINDILESNFFISKRNKDIIIKELIFKLNISLEESQRIYDTAIGIVVSEVKNKLKHPFTSRN